MYDIVNRAQNLTLPVVCCDVTNIQRDPNRVFNKQDSFWHNNARYTTPGTVAQFRTPVPIQINLSMSVLAGYQLDLEQIASNFMAYFNPYIVLATKVPSDLGPEYDLEVRTKATWDGSLGISTPTNLTYADKFRRVGDATFTLDGWIYPEAVDDQKPIYFIDSNFYAVNTDLTTASYYFLSGELFTLSSYSTGTEHKETISLSGTPTITNVFFAPSGQNIELNTNLSATDGLERTVLLYGHRFEDTDYVILSASYDGVWSPSLPLTAFESTYYGPLSGAILPTSAYEIFNDNMMQVIVPAMDTTTLFDIITYNQAGWSSTSEQGIYIERIET